VRRSPNILACMDESNVASAHPVFRECSSEHVFAKITSQVSTPELRALWARMQEEIRRQGVEAAGSHLGGDFTRLKAELGKELAAVELS
jgi:hypothetical protein